MGKLDALCIVNTFTEAHLIWHGPEKPRCRFGIEEILHEFFDLNFCIFLQHLYSHISSPG